MKDLLTRFCELAPKEWGVWTIENQNGRTWAWSDALNRHDGEMLSIELCDDCSSASAIIFLWDWLHARYRSLRNFGGKGWCVLEYSKQYPDPSDIGSPTRIEALVRAVIAVREAECRCTRCGKLFDECRCTIAEIEGPPNEPMSGFCMDTEEWITIPEFIREYRRKKGEAE